MAPSRNSKPSTKKKSNRLAQNVRPLTETKFDTQKSRIKALKDWNEDDMKDEEDQFFAGNDKVLIEHTSGSRYDENDLDIPRQLLDLDSEDDEEEEEDLMEIDEPTSRVPKARKPKPVIDNTQKGRFGKSTKIDDLSESDEDVEEDRSESSNSDQEGDESEEDQWKSYHVKTSSKTLKQKKKQKGVQNAETKAEEVTRHQLELEEVKRLQVKARSKLTAEDFKSYLDYASDSELDEVDQTIAHQQGAMDLMRTSNQKFEVEPEAIAMMLKTQPEVLALVDDYQRNLITLAEVKADIFGSMEKDSDGDENLFNQAIGCLQYHVLSTYLSSAAFYLHLSLKTPATTTRVMGEVMMALVELRTTLNKMDEYGLTGDSDDEELQDMSDLMNAYGGEHQLEDEMVEELKDLQEEELPLLDTSSSSIQRSSDKKSKTSSKNSSKKSVQQKSKSEAKKRKRSALQEEIEDPNLALSSLPERSSLQSLPTPEDSTNEFLEPTFLTSSEAQAKANGKKDLRFYTAKIDAKGKRREKAIRGMDGTATGDSDLPYITKEARRREFLQNQDHGEMEEDDFDEGADGPFGEDVDTEPDQMNYYDTVKELKESAKVAKKAKYDEDRLAERNALSIESEASGAGPRQASRQILKNKGLTPKRAKVNRNPRVKKRLRFEKANKKISSQRPTYNSDQAAKSRDMNGYTGEKSGVKDGLVKSRKL